MQSSNATIKRLTWDEMQRRQAQGLCFNCNERFTPGHRCSQPQLLLLGIKEEEPGIVETLRTWCHFEGRVMIGDNHVSTFFLIV